MNNNTLFDSLGDSDPVVTDAARTAPPELRKDSDLGRVFPSGVKIGRAKYGLGVFSYAFIPAGTPIGRVRGVVVHDPDYSSDYCIAAGEGMALEPAPPFCYLNHSCEPNCTLMHYVNEEEFDGTEVEGCLERSGYSSITKDDLYGEETNPDPMFLGDEDECLFGDGGAECGCDWDEDALGDGGEDENDEDAYEHLYNDEATDVEIWVETSRDILPGEQLTIDYSWPSDRAMRCLCGATACRGWIVDPSELGEIEKGDHS